MAKWQAMKFFLCPLFAVAAVLALAGDSPVAEVSNLTATAVLGWYAWHTATKTIPQLVNDFRDELATERTVHRDDRDAFLHEMAEERMQRHADNLAVIQAMDHLVALLAGPDASAHGTKPTHAATYFPLGETP